ncbi:MAG: GLPGLI family protein [Bacteroidota bacterium]|nr:GLPGLI family protein [Bacteroidota bacterium]
MKYIFLTAGLLLNCWSLQAQQFIKKAEIEFEVKANIKKTLRSGPFMDQIKDQLPQFKTAYFDYIFANDKSIYKFAHWSDDSKKIPDFWRSTDEDNIWYCNYETGKLSMQKNVAGGVVNIEDTLKNLSWRLSNDTRVIAGFNCRKASAIIFDSVYVFAFYTDEIMISGGPCSIHGLPGMILGVTIPRLYTSWIATKVIINDVPVQDIAPVKAKKTYDLKYLGNTIKDNMKDWYSDDETENKELIQLKDRMVWLALL